MRTRSRGELSTELFGISWEQREADYAMMIEFTVHDDAMTARAVASAFFWRKFRPRLFWVAAAAVVLSVMIVMTAYYRMHHTRDDWVLSGIQLTMLVINSLLLLITLGYLPVFLGVYRAIAAWRARRDAVRQVRMTDAEISVVSSRVSATIPWRRFRDLRECPEFFILSYTRSI